VAAKRVFATPGQTSALPHRPVSSITDNLMVTAMPVVWTVNSTLSWGVIT